MKETIPFKVLLQRLNILSERCSYCGLRHPRYELQFHTQQGSDDTPVTESIPMLLFVLGVSENGRCTLEECVEFDGVQLCLSRNASSAGVQTLEECVEFDGVQLLYPDTGLLYATLIDRTVASPYTCQKDAEQAQRLYEEAMGRIDMQRVAKMKCVLKMLSSNYNWRRRWQRKNPPLLEEELRACCKLTFANGDVQQARESPSLLQKECGGAKVADTPKALYRLLYLFRPPSLSFEAMYKECLLVISTPDGRFSVEVSFYKGQLSLYYWAEAALVHDSQDGRWIQVHAGHPGAENGLALQHEEGRLFFQMVQDALNRLWLVDSDNDLVV